MADKPLRKEPKQARSRALVASILEAAGDLLGKGSENPNEIPLQRIADRAGVGIGSVYDYFANGEGVWSGFLGWITERNFTALEKRATGASFTEKLGEMVDGTLDLYLESPARTRGVVLTIVRFGWVKRVVAERDRFAHLLAGRLADEWTKVPRERLVLLSEVLCDAIMGVVMGELWRERTPERTAELRALLRGLVNREVAALKAEYPG